MPGDHENQLILVDSSLMTLFEQFWESWSQRTPPPLPDHLGNHLILVDSIKVIPLALCSVSHEHPVSPLFLPAIFINPLSLKQQFIYSYVYIILPILRITLCVFALAFSLFHSNIHCYSDIFVQLFCIRVLFLYVLCIILILEMYSRYFDPVTGNLFISNT
jgi:hypothetical protein